MNLGDAAKRAFALQDYSPQAPIGGVEIVDLKRFVDDGGAFVELGRLTAGAHAAFPGFEVKQVNYSEVDPGVIKAFHLHRRQTDVWFVPPGDRMLLVLLDCRASSPTENALRRMILGDGATRLVPESHLSGKHPDPARLDYPEIQAEAPAGSAIIWEGRTWHGAGINRSRGPRIGVSAYFTGPQFRQMANWTYGAKPEAYADAPPELKDLLGFKVWGGYGATGDPDATVVEPAERLRVFR